MTGAVASQKVTEALKGSLSTVGNRTKSVKAVSYTHLTQAQKDFPASVYEVVLSGCLNSKGFSPFYSMKDKKLANEMIKSLGIENIKRKSFRELSGGQQQRVLLARALCATKKIIILDEPITGLDPTVTREMYSLIKEINKKGITIIMVSHDINFAVNNASKILHLKKNIKFFGNTEDYANSEVGRRFIGCLLYTSNGIPEAIVAGVLVSAVAVAMIRKSKK